MEGNRPEEKINQENIAGLEKEPKPKVLKISESALYVDGKFLGNINMSGDNPKEDMFEYDPAPDGGLLISGDRETEMLRGNDLIKLPHTVGFVTVDRLLGSKKGVYSDGVFERKMYELTNAVEKRVRILNSLGREMGLGHEPLDMLYLIEGIYRQNEYFSPEELVDFALDGLLEKISIQQEDENRESRDKLSDISPETIRKMIESSGVLSLDEKKHRNGIVNYFYAYCALTKVDKDNLEEIYNKGFENFYLLEDLIKEYREDDPRFTNALAAACKKQKEAWEKEGSK